LSLGRSTEAKSRSKVEGLCPPKPLGNVQNILVSASAQNLLLMGKRAVSRSSSQDRCRCSDCNELRSTTVNEGLNEACIFLLEKKYFGGRLYSREYSRIRKCVGPSIFSKVFEKNVSRPTHESHESACKRQRTRAARVRGGPWARGLRTVN
jgi:hypothetical protein